MDIPDVAEDTQIGQNCIQGIQAVEVEDILMIEGDILRAGVDILAGKEDIRKVEGDNLLTVVDIQSVVDILVDVVDNPLKLVDIQMVVEDKLVAVVDILHWLVDIPKVVVDIQVVEEDIQFAEGGIQENQKRPDIRIVMKDLTREP